MSIRSNNLVLCLMCFARFTTGANAQVIAYDSISGGFNSDLFSGHPFDGILVGNGYKELASPWSPTQVINLTSIEIVIGVTAGSSNAQISLFADTLGAPGALIESYSLSGITNVATIRSVISNTNPILLPTQVYWISIAPGSADTDGTWCNSTSSGEGRLAFRTDPLSSFNIFPEGPYGTIRITGQAVPEPSGAIVLGLVTLVTMRRNKLTNK